ncbi:ribose-5-phosphate isomerase RpiA [soil metagenome]
MILSDSDRLTVLAGEAANLVEDGMVIGLGSGSTAEAFIDALAQHIRSGKRVRGVATSLRSEVRARAAGITLTTLLDAPILDLGVDGADEIDPHLDLVKGRGGALLYEKIVAHACVRWMIVAASEKLVPSLGSRIPLPVEVVAFAWEQTADRLRSLTLEPTLRVAADGSPFVTDGGHYVLDCQTGLINDAAQLATRLKLTTGVVDHGLFIDFADAAMTVDTQGVVTTQTRALERVRS